jgi:hypothetical protein
VNFIKSKQALAIQGRIASRFGALDRMAAKNGMVEEWNNGTLMHPLF